MIIPVAKRLERVKEYYFSRKQKDIKKIEDSGAHVINLGIGSPDLAPSDNTITALSESARTPQNHGYQSYRGIQEFRDALAAWSERAYNISLNSDEEILPLIGSKEGIIYISMAFLDEGDEVLVPNPGYPTYTSVSELVGAKVRHYDLKEENNWAPDLAALSKTDLSKTKLMWVNYPHMPTGAKSTALIFKELIQFAQNHKILLCNDNPYGLVLNETRPESILSLKGAKKVAIELNSLSKSHNMAGWRIGWVAGKKEYIDAILTVNSNVHSGIFLPIQHAATAALNNSQDWHEQRNCEYKKRREIVWSIADVLGCSYNKNQVGLFIWAKAPDNVADVEAFTDEILRKANVCITPGYVFGSNGKRFIRIALCSDIDTLNEALNRIKKWAK